MSTPLDFPPILDSSIMGTFKMCEMRFWWAHMRHQKPISINPDLNAGGSYAKGLEIFRLTYYNPQTGGDLDAAIQAGLLALIKAYGTDDPENTPKTWDRVASAYLSYLEEYPPATDYLKPLILNGKPAVEFNFCLPIADLKHPQTGDPLLYAGTFDMLAERSDEGSIWVHDDKTTKQLGATWTRQWALRSQFTGYCWGASVALHRKVKGASIRGTAIQKTQTKHLPAIVFFEPWKIERWYEQLIYDVKAMIKCWEDNHYGYNLDQSCTAYGGCAYTMLCEAKDPEIWLGGYYETNEWRPLQRK